MNDNDLDNLSPQDVPFSPESRDQGPGGPPEGKSVVAMVFGIVFFIVFIGAIVAGGYYLLSMYSDILRTGVELKPKASVPTVKAEKKPRPRVVSGDYMVLDLYFPSGESLQGERRSVPRASSARDTAAVIVEEFLAGPRGRTGGIIPDKSKLNGVFLGNDSILYIDLSDEFRRNFQGNAMQEYMLLKALHKSLMKNVYQVEGVRLLIDGREVDSVGGHLRVRGLLGEAVASPFREDDDE